MAACSAGSTAHTLHVPSGALWGANDIQKMAEQGTLGSLTITMAKEPSSFKLYGTLKEKLESVRDTPGETVLFDGPVRDLCPMAPHNVNTIACAALATGTATGLGFDGVRARLISNPSLQAHVIDIEVGGNRPAGSEQFTVSTRRYNPAVKGAVTGNATYNSFWASLLRANAGSNGRGLNFC